EFDALFTTDKPVIFAYHGYPWLIHRLAYRRTGHRNLHVRGYKEEGTTTTPFDMVMLNDLDRFHLVMDVIDRLPGLGPKAARRRGRSPTARPDGPGAAAPAEVAGRGGRGVVRAPGGPGGGVLRHRLPRHHPGGRGDLRAAAAVACAVGPTAVRVPRAVPRLRLAASRRDGRPPAPSTPGGDLPPRRGRVAGRG